MTHQHFYIQNNFARGWKAGYLCGAIWSGMFSCLIVPVYILLLCLFGAIRGLIYTISRKRQGGATRCRTFGLLLFRALLAVLTFALFPLNFALNVFVYILFSLFSAPFALFQSTTKRGCKSAWRSFFKVEYLHQNHDFTSFLDRIGAIFSCPLSCV